MLCISCYYEKEIYFWNGMKKRCSFCVRIQTYIIISLQKKYNQNYNNATYHYYSHKRNCWSYQMSWLDYKLHYILMLPIFDETNSAFNCLSCVKFTPWYMFFNAENVKIIFFPAFGLRSTHKLFKIYNKYAYSLTNTNIGRNMQQNRLNLNTLFFEK